MHRADFAVRYGIVPSYPGVDGKQVAVPEQTIRHFLKVLGVAGDQAAMARAEPEPAIAGDAAAKCHFPDWLRNRRAWGIAVQLYEIRSSRNWGIGDFADLASFCETAAGVGADFVGLNPLHALFLAAPDRCSPFSPSNRRFLNPLYIAVDQLDGFDPDMVDKNELSRLRQSDLVDYQAVARTKLGVLRKIWRDRQLAAREEVRAMRQEDPLLERHALFEALSLKFAGEGLSEGWKGWPEPFADPRAREVRAFAEAHANEVDFHIWLQWLARDQLAEARRRARAAGMRIGLYLDLAVGEAPDGSAGWSDQELAVSDVSIGAPPDLFSARGQDWGLTPLSPLRLAENGFRSYEGLMSAAMRDAGALRIDHAMSLQQLFWIPAGHGAADGGFVRYPMTGMLQVLAELSRKHQTIMIGEDLGHVPDGFRDSMLAADIFSYRILYFEKRAERFRPARQWPALAIACLSTHDLPTLKGWWRGGDVELRLEHRLIDDAAAARQRRERRTERRHLVRRLQAEGLVRRLEARDLSATMTLDDSRTLDDAGYLQLASAAHRFIARTPSRLACIRLADAVGEEHPTNVPGTSDEYPNWRRKLAVPIEDLLSLPTFRAITSAMARERPA